MIWRNSLFRLVTITTAVVGALLGVAGGPAMADPPRNIALKKPYTMEPKPNYDLTIDSTDNVKLTDGRYTTGYFWTQRISTVGWQRGNPVIVTIDLEKVCPISGVSVNTAAGTAGVTWPTKILIFTSDDGATWGEVGDLIPLALGGSVLDPSKYASHRFSTSAIQAKGRYVKLIIDQYPFTFLDEIEVYDGPESFLHTLHARSITTDPVAAFYQHRVYDGIRSRMRSDLRDAQLAMGASTGLRQKQKQGLLERAQKLAMQIDSLPLAIPGDFRTILPLNELHSKIYALYAPLHQAAGLKTLTAWVPDRWAMLGPTQAPRENVSAIQGITVDVMRGERRSAAFNLTNPTEKEIIVYINIAGLPGDRNPEYVSVYEVLFTDTAAQIPIAAALVEAKRSSKGYAVSVPPGMTRQVWMSFGPSQLASQTCRGQIEITAPGGVPRIRMPLSLRVWPFDFPVRPEIHVGGWDYVQDKGMLDATPGNIQNLIQLLAANHVDMPWGTSSVQPNNVAFDSRGELVQIAFDKWDEWSGKWPKARRYAVFLNTGNNFQGEPTGTERFNQMVSAWIRSWVNHIKSQGLRPNQLVLLLVDEPQRAEQVERVVNWAKAIKAAEPLVSLAETTAFTDPRAIDPGFFSNIDVIIVNLTGFMRGPEWLRGFYVEQQRAGRELWFYSCEGPAKLLDPITYHRGQFWWAIKYAARGSLYWAFADEGGIGSWNIYSKRVIQYSPLFLSPGTVTMGKHMAAISEGAQDYQYFTMLQDRIEELDRRGIRSELLERARRLRSQLPEIVVSMITEKSLAWAEPKDRGKMDEFRLQVLEMLLALSRL